MSIEWTREGSLKLITKARLRVDADGDLDRYIQECMIVHDRVAPYMDQCGWYRRRIYKLLSLSLYVG